MNYESYNMDVAGLTEAFNGVKDLLLGTLQKDGIIGDGEALGAKYVVVVHKKGWFGRAYDKLFGGVEDKPGTLKYTILRAHEGECDDAPDKTKLSILRPNS